MIRLFIILFNIICLPTYAFQTVNNKSPLVLDINYLEDSESIFSINDVLSQSLDSKFLSIPKKDANFGYTKSAYWFHFSLSNIKLKDINKLLVISYPLLDFIDFYRVENNTVIEHIQTGDHYKFSQRPIIHSSFIFPITIKTKSTVDIYIRVSTKGSMHVPMKLGKPLETLIEISKNEQVHTILYGVLGLISFFNFLVFLALKESTYLYYSLTTLAYVFFVAILQGKAFQHLYPSFPFFNEVGVLVVIPLGIIFSALFVRSFLSLKKTNRTLDNLVKGVIVLSFLNIVFSLLADYELSIKVNMLNIILSHLFFLMIGAMNWKKRGFSTKNYIVAWSMLFFGTITTTLSKAGVLPSNFFTEYGIQLGSAFSAILFTIALAQRLFQEREEKLIAQANTIESLNTLTAGMAHEINNPTNFTNAAVFMMKEEIALVKLYLIKLAGGTKADSNILTSFDEKFSKLINLNETAMEGTERIKSIVTDLSTFAQIYNSDKKHKTSIEDSINSNISLIKTRFDYIKFQLDFDDIPQISTFPSKLNQVFMNILVNACQAIELKRESHSNFTGQITINLEKQLNNVILTFKDNGCGMDKVTQHKIFDPFFTTKEVGTGTGLGMAISFGIIEVHGGTINIESDIGQGSTLTVSLPV